MKRKGSALLVVLFIVMTITILSLGFLSRSDVELACGENMILRTKMDYLAESGLEHAKGLILNPQDIDSEYWTGDMQQQLAAGSDYYYDVNVVKLGECNYQITCDAYREKGGERTGSSSLKTELRLDPCIALWMDRDTTVFNGMIIDGDVYCNGTLTNNGTIDGDVFSNILNGSGSKSGQEKMTADLSLQWPRVTAADFTSKYPTVVIGASLSGQTFGPYEPVRVCHHNGELQLAGGVTIDGMLVVEGDLRIGGNGNTITAAKNLPAMLVTGDMIIENGGQLDVYGLAVVDGEIQINAGTTDVGILGGLFIGDSIVETTEDSSGNGNTGTLYNSPTWRPVSGKIDGALEFDGVNDYIDLGNLDVYGNELTISAWFKADDFEGHARIISKATGIGTQNHYWMLSEYNNKLRFRLKTDGITDTIVASTGVLSVGVWTHAAAVYDGSFMILYKDGVEVGRIPKTGVISANSTIPVWIGRNPGNYSPFDGMIDDVRIYNRALEASEIYPIPGEVGLVAHWKLDEQGNDNISITAAPSKTAIIAWSEAGITEKWGQAAGAFFRSIERK